MLIVMDWFSILIPSSHSIRRLVDRVIGQEGNMLPEPRLAFGFVSRIWRCGMLGSHGTRG